MLNFSKSIILLNFQETIPSPQFSDSLAKQQLTTLVQVTSTIWTFPQRTLVILFWPLWWFDLTSPNSELKWRNSKWEGYWQVEKIKVTNILAAASEQLFFASWV